MTTFKDRFTKSRALTAWVPGGVLVVYLSLQAWSVVFAYDVLNLSTPRSWEQFIFSLSIQHSFVSWACGTVLLLTCAACLVAGDEG